MHDDPCSVHSSSSQLFYFTDNRLQYCMEGLSNLVCLGTIIQSVMICRKDSVFVHRPITHSFQNQWLVCPYPTSSSELFQIPECLKVKHLALARVAGSKIPSLPFLKSGKGVSSGHCSVDRASHTWHVMTLLGA